METEQKVIDINKLSYNIFILPNKKFDNLSYNVRLLFVTLYFTMWLICDLLHLKNGYGFVIAFVSLSCVKDLPVFIYKILMKRKY